MKHVGIYPALIACCFATSVWAADQEESATTESNVSLTNAPAPVEVPDEEAYAPWQIYGYAAYDTSAVARYNGWPQVCVDGLWDNFCNEKHCHCYTGPKQHCHHGMHFQAGCNSCQNFAGGHLRHGHFKKNCGADSAQPTGCSNGACGEELADSVIHQGPALEVQPTPELLDPEEPASPSDRPVNTSVELYPETSTPRPLLPALWRSRN